MAPLVYAASGCNFFGAAVGTTCERKNDDLVAREANNSMTRGPFLPSRGLTSANLRHPVTEREADSKFWSPKQNSQRHSQSEHQRETQTAKQDMADETDTSFSTEFLAKQISVHLHLIKLVIICVVDV